jgi:AraC family transcriptional regulator
MNHALASPADPQHNQTAYGPRTEHVSLTVLSELLDDALRMWDQDRITAKSQISVAAAMSRGALTGTQDEAPRLHTGGLAPWQAHKVAEFIDASLDSKIRLRDCAKQTRLSANYFSRAFKATFGTTVAYYIRRRRVERAQRLMLLSSMPLSQVALATGFSDQAHYCRVFRDVMGISPNVWRRKHMTMTPTERDIGECPENGGMPTREVRSVGSIADRGNGDAMGVAVDYDGG